jgi:hypothetical protein
MPQVIFEPTIPVFEWAKTVDALDRAATVIGDQELRFGVSMDFAYIFIFLLSPSSSLRYLHTWKHFINGLVTLLNKILLKDKRDH